MRSPCDIVEQRCAGMDGLKCRVMTHMLNLKKMPVSILLLADAENRGLKAQLEQVLLLSPPHANKYSTPVHTQASTLLC